MGDNFIADIVDINFSGDLCGLKNEELIDYIRSFIKKYPAKKGLFNVGVYIKKIKTDSSGRPLIFSSFVADTAFGLVSSDSTEWGFRNSLRQGIKSLLTNMDRTSDEQTEIINYEDLYA